MACEEHELRELLHQEIENKSKSCSNPTYECSVPRIDGYDYCIRHILRDARGNYRQCTFTYGNGRKCPKALQNHDTAKDPALTTLCFEHSRQTQLQKTHTTTGKLRRIGTNETLLQSLVHHLNVDDVSEKMLVCEQDEEIDVVSPHVTPFLNYDQIHSLTTTAATKRKRRRLLDYASDNSSDDEVICINNTGRGYENNSSDNESVDSQDEDTLKHAGIYTRQEAIRLSEEKLTKLQGLYIDQINRLHHILKERRRRYLHALRKEREILCSIHEQVKETHQERLLYEQLKALNTYHRRHGVEAVLYKKFKEKRSRANESYGHKALGFPKCVYTEGGVKCGDRVLPCSKFCRKHILEDKKQILFRACEIEKSSVICKDPIPCIFDDSTCVLHLVIPTERPYNQKQKYESEPEDDDKNNVKQNDEVKQEKEEEMNAKLNMAEEWASTTQAKNNEHCNVTINH